MPENSDPTEVVLEESPMSDTQDTLNALVEEALANPEIPKMYFNNFVTAVGGQGDIVLLLRLNDQTVAVLNASYTIAKTLAERLAGGITELERVLDTTIFTTDQIRAKASKDTRDDHNE